MPRSSAPHGFCLAFAFVVVVVFGFLDAVTFTIVAPAPAKDTRSDWAALPRESRVGTGAGASAQPSGTFTAIGLAVALLAGVRSASRGRFLATGRRQQGRVKVCASSNLDTSGQLPFVKLTRGADEATVYLHGACVASYKTNGTEWIAVRDDAAFDGTKPIAGGLQMCFPQFGPGKIRQHGFARDLPWRVVENQGGTCVLELTDNEETRSMWPHAFRCQFRVELQDGRLSTTLTVHNKSESAFTFQAALHSYFAVDDVKNCSVVGNLVGAEKIDQTCDPWKITKSTTDAISITKFTEEIYKDVFPGTVSLRAPKGELLIEHKEGWADLKVWNPWGNEKMGADRFVCVESCELDDARLEPNATWVATMSLVPTAA